jgi:pilus assembly protein CpaE
MSIQEQPTVILGHDMSPEMAAQLSSTLRELGVVVKADNGSADRAPSRVIVVVSPKGGSGKTAVASNLSVALAQSHPGRVVAVDLDVQFGDLAAALRLEPQHTFAQLVRAGQVDATTVKLFLTPHDQGLYVLAGASDPVDADVIGHGHISEVLPLLAQSFDYVVVDTPAGLDERTLAAIDAATDLLLVTSLDVTSIRSIRKALDVLDHLDLRARRELVLNRCDAKVGLDPADVERAIGMPISCSIPSSREVPLSLNLGTPVVLTEPKSVVSKKIHQLADHYTPSTELGDGLAKRRKAWRR